MIKCFINVFNGVGSFVEVSIVIGIIIIIVGSLGIILGILAARNPNAR